MPLIAAHGSMIIVLRQKCRKSLRQGDGHFERVTGKVTWNVDMEAESKTIERFRTLAAVAGVATRQVGGSFHAAAGSRPEANVLKLFAAVI